MAKGRLNEVQFDGFTKQPKGMALPITQMEKIAVKVIVNLASKADDLVFGKVEEVIYRSIVGKKK